MRIRPSLPIAALLAVLVAGCSSMAHDPTQDWTAEQFYEEARAALKAGDYQQAIKYYESLEARFPFGRHAQQAQIEVAYTYYKYAEPDNAISAADRFIKMNPRHPHVDYAYYLKGLANYNRGVGLIDQWTDQDMSERDPGAARQSFYDFAELVKQFPESRYANDARQRMIHLRNSLAQHEIHVADYYLRRGAHIAAANRAKYVLENYQKTPAVPMALKLMAEAYRRLGMDDLAADAERVYQHNYGDAEPAAAGLPKLPADGAQNEKPAP